MLNQICDFFTNVWEIAIVIWEWIFNAVPMIGDICLFFISVYTFYLTVYPKRLRIVSFASSIHIYEGSSFEVVLENRSLTAIGIQSIYLDLNEDNRVKIFDSDEDGLLTIEGFHTQKIKMKSYTGITGIDGKQLEIKIDKKLSLIVYTSRGIQQVVCKFKNGFKRKKKSKNTATAYRKGIDGKVVSPFVKYGLIYLDKKEHQHTICITESGYMSEPIFGFNRLDETVINDEEKLKQFFKGVFEKEGLPYEIKIVDSL